MERPPGAVHKAHPARRGPYRKVLALDGSPRPAHLSTTSHMLERLVGGMREAGADASVFELSEARIAPCTGCMRCWFEHQGKCVHDDDMSRELYGRWLEADLVVYATPVYQLSMSALLKTFVERTLPSLEPWVVEREGAFVHPARHEAPASVVLAVCGLPAWDEFAPLSLWARTLFGRYSTLVAEIYRTESEAISRQKHFLQAESVLKATARAGWEIVESGEVADGTMARIRQPILGDPEDFCRLTNMMLRSCMETRLSPKEYQHGKMRPRPESMDEFILVMRSALAAAARAGSEAAIQFRFGPQPACDCHFELAGGRVKGAPGAIAHPDLVIETPFELWMDVVAGRVDPRPEFAAGRCRASGNLSLLGFLAPARSAC